MYKRKFRRRRRTRFKSSYKRRTKFRYARRGVFPGKRSRPTTEVKYADSFITGKAVQTTINTDGNAPVNQALFSRILEIIPQGVARNNRIGNRIFVKHITLRVWAHTCGFSYLGNNYSINDAFLRLVCTDSDAGNPNAAPVVFNVVNNFFSNNTVGKNKILCPINRRNYQVYYDKVHHVVGTVANSSVALNANLATGGQIFKTIKIPVNRGVEFTDAGTIKECYDNFTFHAFALMPEYAAYGSGNVAPVCLDAMIRIYFTDP